MNRFTFKKLGRVMLMLTAVIALGLTGCGGDDNPSGGGGGGNNTVAKGTFTDSRDSKTYKTVKIGSQTWMAENLNYETSGSKCYGNSPDSCAKYGKLYTWNAAKTACPSGYHLPTNDEWSTLVKAAGDNAGKKLKSKSGWNGTDNFGFSALPGGWYNAGSERFADAGSDANWWAASEKAGYGYQWYMEAKSDYVYSDDHTNGNGSGESVRCIKD
jgi:uncharacterized protein (TIGR02145 family)